MRVLPQVQVAVRRRREERFLGRLVKLLQYLKILDVLGAWVA